MNQHPPSCALVLHVGVTGHRELPEAAVPAIAKTVATVLATIDVTVRGIAEAESRQAPETGAPLLRVISSLAEGADQLVAETALERGWEVQCPLPFAREEYAKDFSGEAAERYAALLARAKNVFEHAGDRRHADWAYLEAGRTMLAQSDLIIAVWDGQPSRGMGGTAEVVREAMAKGLPVVRIDPARPEVPTLLGAPAENTDWAVGVQQYLDDLLSLEDHKGLGRLRRYLGETQRLFNWGWVYFLFRNRFSGGKWSGSGARRASYAAATSGWEAEWKTEPPMPAQVGRQIDDGLRGHYAWTNGLAETYAGLFRSAFILRYFLVTLSVLVGAVGFYTPNPWGWMGFVAQVLCLVAAVGLILCDNKNRWQRKAVEYRWIAEQLRIHRYVLPLGRAVFPVAQAGHPIYEGPRWGRRQVRCIVRRIGLPAVCVDTAYLQAHRAFILENEIAGDNGQQKYHAKNADRNRLIAGRLYRWAMWLFAAGMVAIIARMALWAWFEVDKALWWKLVKAAAATLPALGVMFSSLRAHGEFKRLSARSKAMAEFLAARAAAFRVNEAPTWTESVDDTTRLALVLRAEVADWNTVMESRGLALPV